MIASLILLIGGAALTAAQGLSSLPPCGQTCIKNMLAKAPSFGCAVGNVTCYCTTPQFGYGVRDCSLESCPSPAEANEVISFGTAYCNKALASGGGGGSPSGSPSGGSTPTGASASSPASSGGSGSSSGAAGSSGGGVGGKVPITTSILSGVETTGGSKVTTATGKTTIFGIVSPLKSTETTGGSTITTVTGSTTLTGAKASAAVAKGKGGSTKSGGSGSNMTKGGGGSGNSEKSSTSSGLAPAMTAVPGLIGAAMIAVLAL